MNNCDNELKIFDFVEDELSEQDEIEIAEHLQQCSSCKKLYDEYVFMKKSTNTFYSSIDFNQAAAKQYKIVRTGKIFKRASIAFPIAASFVLGFLLILNNSDQDNNFVVNTDSTYNLVQEPLTILNQSEWNLKLNLLQHKIELIQDQMKH